jgi:hypothetical protein
MYSRIPACRVCQCPDDKAVSDMDSDLLNGLDLDTVLAKYSGSFTDPEKYINRTWLYSHRRHLRKSVPNSLLNLPDLSTGNNSKLANPERSQGFDNYLGTVEKDREMVDVLVASALEDLNNSDEMVKLSKLNPQAYSMLLSTRDRIRDSLGKMMVLNREIVSPNVTFNIGEANNKLFIEFLLIIKKSSEASIEDKTVREAFIRELTNELRKSKEFKFLITEEKERHEDDIPSK